MARRRYSDDDRANTLAALDANGGDVNRTAEETGVPRSTIRRWVDGDVVAELRQQKKGELADRLEELAHRLVNALPDKIKAANLQQTATTLGITIDKMQLLRGKPTSITDDASLTDAERATEVNRLLDAARERAARQAHQDGAG